MVKHWRGSHNPSEPPPKKEGKKSLHPSSLKSTLGRNPGATAKQAPSEVVSATGARSRPAHGGQCDVTG